MKTRARIREEPRGLCIEIPARRHPFLVLYVAFALAVWALGEAAIVHALLGGEETVSNEDLVGAFICLVPWTAVGTVILAAGLWLAVGRAVVTVTDRALTIRCEVPGLGTSRTYDTAHVHALRLAPWWVFRPWAMLGFTLWLWPGAGPIAVDYGARTVRFGNGLEEPEARGIAARIAERLRVPLGESGAAP